MEKEFKVLKFPNSSAGQAEKIRALSEASAKGWTVVSETITADAYDVESAAKQGACWCFVCGPFCAPFMVSGVKKTGSITITFSRSAEDRLQVKREEQAQREASLERQLEDRRLANIASVVDKFREECPGEELSKYIVIAACDFIENRRRIGGPIPSIRRSIRLNGGVELKDDSGIIITTYSSEEVRGLPKVVPLPDDYFGSHK